MYLTFNFFRNGRRISIFLYIYIYTNQVPDSDHTFLISLYVYRTKSLNVKLSTSIYFELLVVKEKKYLVQIIYWY